MERSETMADADQADAGVTEHRPRRRGRRCKFCGEPRAATLQCDYPKPRRAGSPVRRPCDAHMCSRCSRSVAVPAGGENVDLCPKHASLVAASSPGLARLNASVLEKAQQLHAGRTELGRTHARLAHVETTLAAIERVCTAHGFDAGGGESVAEWIAARLGELETIYAAAHDARRRARPRS